MYVLFSILDSRWMGLSGRKVSGGRTGDARVLGSVLERADAGVFAAVRSVPVCIEGAVCNLHENGLYFSILKENINVLSCMFLGTILLRFSSIQSLENIC